MAFVNRVMCTKSDCFQNKCESYCDLLTEPIVTHECPFYKTHEQVTEERKEVLERLRKNNKKSLIKTYYETNRRRDW